MEVCRSRLNFVRGIRRRYGSNGPKHFARFPVLAVGHYPAGPLCTAFANPRRGVHARFTERPAGADLKRNFAQGDWTMQPCPRLGRAAAKARARLLFCSRASTRIPAHHCKWQGRTIPFGPVVYPRRPVLGKWLGYMLRQFLSSRTRPALVQMSRMMRPAVYGKPACLL